MVRQNARDVGAGGFPADDPSHPLYLHPSDNPGAVLVSELLNGENYLDWSRSMHTALLAKNKLGLVDGSVFRPDVNDATLNAWIRCNSMVVSWLRNSTTKEIKSSLLYLNNAAQIWRDLKDRFSQGDDARIYQLKQQLFSLKQGSLDVNTYYTSLRVIWDEYTDLQPKGWCDCGACRCNSAVKWRDYQLKDFNMHFLMGLNESYASLKTHLMSLDPLPGFGKVFSLVLQEERQRSAGFSVKSTYTVSPSEQVGMLSNATQSTQSSYGNRSRDKFFCTHCHKTNHTVDKCYQLHGFPPGFGRGRGRPPDGVSSAGRSVNNVSQVCEGGDNAAVSPNLTAEQCTQLITFLQQQLQVGGSSSSQQPAHSNSLPSSSVPGNQAHLPITDPNLNFSGFFKGEDDWDGA